MTATSIRARNLAAAVSMALAATGLHAATITVDSTDDSPDSTHCNLRFALQAINDGATANAPTCSAAVSGSAFGTNDTVQFAGELAGNGITLAQGTLSLTAASVTIAGSGQFIDAAGTGTVLAVGQETTLAANNLYLKGGASVAHGGGVMIGYSAQVQLTDCAISGNTAVGKGGALYLSESATLSLVRSTVSLNSARTGGAIFAKGGAAVTVTDSLIAYNSASYSAGAIYSSGSALTLDMATIKGNSAPYYSGGIVAMFDTLAFSRSTIAGNGGARAGGMFVRSSNGTIATSTISGNTALCGTTCGGAAVVENSTLAIIGSTLSRNLAAGHAGWVSGGAMLVDGATTFVNSTISDNIGVGDFQVSGAAWNFQLAGDGLTFVNSTVSGNTAAAFFGGAVGGVLLGKFYLSPPPLSTGKLTLRNTIMSANAPADTDIVWDQYSDTVAAAYSLIGTSLNVAPFNDPGDHNVFSDSPEILGLNDNGGATKTQALLPGSPALGAGSRVLAAYAGMPLNYDQRGPGYPRDTDGSVDIGAFQDQGDRMFASGFEPEP